MGTGERGAGKGQQGFIASFGLHEGRHPGRKSSCQVPPTTHSLRPWAGDRLEMRRSPHEAHLPHLIRMAALRGVSPKAKSQMLPLCTIAALQQGLSVQTHVPRPSAKQLRDPGIKILITVGAADHNLKKTRDTSSAQCITKFDWHHKPFQHPIKSCVYEYV